MHFLCVVFEMFVNGDLRNVAIFQSEMEKAFQKLETYCQREVRSGFGPNFIPMLLFLFQLQLDEVYLLT
jgi:hypothetical protein